MGNEGPRKKDDELTTPEYDGRIRAWTGVGLGVLLLAISVLGLVRGIDPPPGRGGVPREWFGILILGTGLLVIGALGVWKTRRRSKP
jgi:hypothetical protein